MTNRKEFFFILIGLCGILFGNAQESKTFQTITEMSLLNDEDALEVGDRIWYEVIEEREEPQRLFVNDEGKVKVPLIGRVDASEKTPKELAYDIQKELKKEFFHNATVIVRLRSGGKRGEFSVLGEVKKPGKQTLPVDDIVYVSDAILAAGNFTNKAKKREVILIREDPQNPDSELRYKIDVGGVLKTGAYEQDKVVKPEDLIIVPEREEAGGKVYINGEVKSTGLYPIPPNKGVTVSKAILMAGGFTEWAKKNKVKLIRANENLEADERTLIIKVGDILEKNKKSLDPEVKPGDVIRVEEAMFKF